MYVSDYPQHAVEAGHVEPVPRRVRAIYADSVVLDTTRALYVWETPAYPQFFIPRADVDERVMVDEDHPHTLKLGSARRYGLRVGEHSRAQAARLYVESPVKAVVDHFRFEWAALDSWFEEDEAIFVHPRSPYARVDAVRSTRRVDVALDGVVLAGSGSPVMVFETGLPTRYYLNRTEVDFSCLEPSATVTACPYKGRTTAYWSARIGGELYEDIAWCYDFPTVGVAQIAGLVSFYNERVDIALDGRRLGRPKTKFS